MRARRPATMRTLFTMDAIDTPRASPEAGEPLAANILLVDDEAANLALLQRTLRIRKDYVLTATDDARSVLNRCLQQRFDLVILDLNMPHMNGFQVMRQLREIAEDRRPAILIVTAQDDQAQRLQALHAGAADYITKPFLLDELLARVGNLIEARLSQTRMQALNRALEAGVRERTEALLRSRQMIRELAAHHEKIREAERARIAREIHDEFGQYLTALRMDIAMLSIQHGANNLELRKQLADMKETLDTSIGVVRNLAAALRPGALDMGLVSAAEWLLAGFAERTGTAYRLHAPREDLALDEDAQRLPSVSCRKPSPTSPAMLRHAK